MTQAANGRLSQSQMISGGLLKPVMSPGLKSPHHVYTLNPELMRRSNATDVLMY